MVFELNLSTSLLITEIIQLSAQPQISTHLE